MKKILKTPVKLNPLSKFAGKKSIVFFNSTATLSDQYSHFLK